MKDSADTSTVNLNRRVFNMAYLYVIHWLVGRLTHADCRPASAPRYGPTRHRRMSAANTKEGCDCDDIFNLLLLFLTLLFFL